MGKWDYKDEYEDQIISEVHGQIETTKDAFYAHNADCDAYEARIAELEKTLLATVEERRKAVHATLELGFEVKELEAELARVKAESLRVVHSGETEARNTRFFVRQAGSILWQRIAEPDRFRQISAFDVRDPDTRCCIPADEKVNGVRLERWETEE